MGTNIILIILVSAILSLCNGFFFFMGYLFHKKTNKETNAIELTEANQEYLRQLGEWISYDGGNKR